MDPKIKLITFSGIFISLILGVGYALAYVPNVELVTALIFMSGVLMGIRQGLIIGALGEFLFSALNPIGSGLIFPPTMIAQVVTMAIIGALGGITRNYIIAWKPTIKNCLLIFGLGLGLTLFYDIMVSLAFPISAGFNFREMIGVVIAGLGFSLIHILVNAMVFLLIVPHAVQRVYQAIPFFRTDSGGNDSV